MHYEVEQKFRVVDLPATEAALAALGIACDQVVQQTDTYYAHPARDFRLTDEALRLRHIRAAGQDQPQEELRITYKGPKIDAATKTRHEIELPLAAGEEYARGFAALLVALGFTPAGTVNKTRRSTSMAWDGQTVEVAIDQVDQLGCYLELEISADKSSLDAARQTLLNLAVQLGLQDTERRSYLEMVLLTH